MKSIKVVTNCTLAELCGSAINQNVWREMIMVIGRDLTVKLIISFFFFKRHIYDPVI